MKGEIHMPADTVPTCCPALRRCWHPVAYSRSVGDGPHAATLLDDPIVLWRDSAGTPHAFKDLCIHRGTALSLGSVQGDEIVCAYHGWRYRADGACTVIPQHEDPTMVPKKARAEAFGCQERYGLIWVAMEPPRWPLPSVPEIEDPSWRTVVALDPPATWKCDASRQVENFTDFAHFPWVHPGLLGDPSRPVVPPHDVRVEDGHVLHYEFVRPEAPNSSEYPVFPDFSREKPTRHTRYQLHLPYTIVVRMSWGKYGTLVYLFSSQPVAADRCIGYVLIARNYNLGQSDHHLQDFEQVIFGQDKRVVESQRPEQVPFDLAAELHLKFDAVAVAYRRAIGAAGLV